MYTKCPSKNVSVTFMRVPVHDRKKESRDVFKYQPVKAHSTDMVNGLLMSGIKMDSLAKFI